MDFTRGRSSVLKLGCCDCGLVHRVAFAIERNGKLGIAMERDNRATSAARRAMKGLRIPKDGAFR